MMINVRNSVLICACFLLLVLTSSAEEPPLPVDLGTMSGDTPSTESDASDLLYIGRFDRSNPKISDSEWPNSTITLRFVGTGAKAFLTLRGNRILVTIDGRPTKMLVFDDETKKESSPRLYVVAEGLPAGEHEITLTKVTEAFYGAFSFHGFKLDGRILPATQPQRRITVIGDSISAGAGNESGDRNEHLNAANQNAWLSYGAIAARSFDAAYTAIAWSGRKLWPDYTITEVYNRCLPTRPDSLWPGDAAPSDVIVVNLCTNDFAQDNPDEESWVNAYHVFLDELRNDAPKSVIYCAIGPMIHDFWPPGKQARSTASRYIERVVKERNTRGDQKIRFIDFGVRNEATDGIGADWHPTVKSHQGMAEALISVIQSDLSWQRK